LQSQEQQGTLGRQLLERSLRDSRSPSVAPSNT
jgi:hypothetical protein